MKCVKENTIDEDIITSYILLLKGSFARHKFVTILLNIIFLELVVKNINSDVEILVCYSLYVVYIACKISCHLVFILRETQTLVGFGDF